MSFSTRIESSVLSLLLPHKYPFLLLDRVIELDPGKAAVGIKNVTIGEPYFVGHFPGEPIVPGVLLLESLAQITAVMYISAFFPPSTDWSNLDFGDVDPAQIAAKVGYLVEIKSVKFKKVVQPGDTLILRTSLKGNFANLSQVQVAASVDSIPVVEGLMTVSQRP